MAAQFAQSDWEMFDAASLFDETPRLHVNKVTYTDDLDSAAESVPSDTGHEDEVTAGKGDSSEEADERELQADKEEGTPPAGEQTSDNDFVSDESPAEASAEAGEGAGSGEAEGEPEAEAGGSAGSGGEAASPESVPQGEDGAEEPIQKEPEGVEEVAEATSKTSEDVHGGDEATKDIEDSPNAADDGQTLDNQGAEDGKGGETGEQTPDKTSASDDSPAEASAEAGEGAGSGEAEGEPEAEAGGSAGSGGEAASPESVPQGEAEDPSDADPISQEDWEAHADQTALTQQVTNALAEVAAVRPASAAGGGAAVDYSGEAWDINNLRAVFFRTRELIKKLVSEEDFTTREEGSSRWWASELARNAVSFRHAQIPSSRYDRPKMNNIVFFMDVSGSVSTLAELFMAIMGGAAGLPGVRIVVGSEAHAENEIVVKKPFRTVEAATDFFRKAVNAHVCDGPYCTSCKGKIRHVGWTRPYEWSFEPGVVEFLRAHGLYDPTTTCVFFGDMQAVNFTASELRKLVRDVKCLWLFTDEPGHYTHTGDLPRAVEARLPIVYNVRSAQSFAHAVKRLR